MRELSQHILDLLQNGIEAGARHLVLEIDEDQEANLLSIRVRDDGRGMPPEVLQRVTDPFFTTRTTRTVGLGVPLLKAAAEHCNGAFDISSEPGEGTEVWATFQRDHIDRAPLGDMVATLMGVLLSEQPCDVSYRHRVNGERFELDTAELREMLGDVPLSHPQVRRWIQDYIREGLGELYRADHQAVCSRTAGQGEKKCQE